MRSASKAARRWGTRESHQESRTRSRSSWVRAEKRLKPPPPSAVSGGVSHSPRSCATYLRSDSRGFRESASTMASGTPSSDADGRPSPPGANVSQIASSARRWRCESRTGPSPCAVGGLRISELRTGDYLRAAPSRASICGRATEWEEAECSRAWCSTTTR